MIDLLIILIVAVFIITVASVAYFYRDPDREIPAVDNALLSPVDGTVISIRKYKAGRVPIISKDGRYYSLEELTHSNLLDSDGVILSIHISPLDVHAVRSPFTGKVLQISHIHGGLKFMRDPTFEYTNERVSLILENRLFRLGLVIVGAPIVSSVRGLIAQNDEVSAGQRIAFIRLGSLVSLIIPDTAGLRIGVRCGGRVVGGVTKIASSGERHEIEECYVFKRTTIWERLYLVFLAIYSLARRITGIR